MKLKANARGLMVKETTKGLDEEILSFAGHVHRQHSNKILNDKYKHVHDAMDKMYKKLGGNHRIYGHNVKFLTKNFKSKGERSAGYVHLMGDLLSDILSEVLKAVLIDINKNKMLPPQFFIIKDGNALWDIDEKDAKKILRNYGKGEWDIKDELIREMIKRFSNGYVSILKNTKKRKCKDK